MSDRAAQCKVLAYAQQLGNWAWASVAGSNKKSVEDSALAGCRQMASKEGLAEPCLIYGGSWFQPPSSQPIQHQAIDRQWLLAVQEVTGTVHFLVLVFT